MEILKSIIKNTVGAIAELTDSKSPFDKPVRPSARSKVERRTDGRNVIEVTANNYREASQYAEGVTPAGSGYIAINHIGYKRWEIVYEEFEK